MGRKNKLKSTFIDKVIPGTLWKCHNKDRIMLHQTLTWIEKNDFWYCFINRNRILQRHKNGKMFIAEKTCLLSNNFGRLLFQLS